MLLPGATAAHTILCGRLLVRGSHGAAGAGSWKGVGGALLCFLLSIGVCCLIE